MYVYINQLARSHTQKYLVFYASVGWQKNVDDFIETIICSCLQRVPQRATPPV